MFSKDLSINLRQEEILLENRSGKNRREPPGAQKSLPQEKPYILYVWGDTERNSSQALRIGQNIKDELAVVDVRRLGGGEMEPWLTGVPTLLDVSEKTVFRGTKCLDFLDRLATVPSQRPFMRREEDNRQQQQQQTIPMPPMRQPHMMQNSSDPPDPSVLPHFQEPEQEKEEHKQRLKNEVEAIMARREAMVGSKKEQQDE
jgi:hypothetical protein